MTERFALQGERGAEVVQEVLNRCFGRMVALIHGFDGEVVKFAGDATLALWSCPEGADMSLAVRRAAACGLAIQEALDGLDAAGSGRLRFRLGIGAGEVWAALVGGFGGQWEALVGGAPLEQAAQAEREANPGEVLLSPAAWALGRDFCAGVPNGSHLRLLRAAAPPPHEDADPMEPPATVEHALRAFIPPVVLSRLAAGQGGYLSEFRQVTAMFVGLREADGSAPEALDRLQTAARCLQQSVAHYGGSVNQLMVDDQGTTLVAGWGLPLHTHEDDAARGALAALAAEAELRACGFTAAIGLATGRVFTGLRGGPERLEYAMIGGPVNLAARLRQAVGEGILCDGSTRAAAGRRVQFADLPPIRVKGRTEPVAVCRPLREEKSRLQQRREIVGRREELRALDAELAALRQGGPGGVMILEGEAGMGKSLLVAELLDRARQSGIRNLLAAGEALDRSAAYNAFREVFARLLGLDSSLEPDAQRSRLLAWLEPRPDLAARAPLLNSILPFVLAETPTTQEIAPEARGDVARHLLIEVFEQATAGETTLLVVEDAHWLDTASWAFIESLQRQLRRLLIVIATRPLGEEEVTPEYRRLLEASGDRRRRLMALAAEEVEALACRRLEVEALPLPVKDLLHGRAEGHPLFVEELVLALRERGLLRVEQGRARLAVDEAELASLGFPATVQGVIAGRIDRLSPEQQLTLKVSSVLGRSFELRMLQDVHPLLADKGELLAHLEDLADCELLESGPPGPERSFLFRHAIIQEVAYGLLPYAQRRPLHSAVAAWIERTCGGIPSYEPLLAHHWREAGEARKALDCFESAGEHALANFANREAARFFSAAIELESDVPSSSPPLGAFTQERRARRRLRLGKAHVGVSSYDRGQRNMEEGLALLDAPIPAGPVRQVAGILAQVLRQVAHRAWSARFLGRGAERRDLLLETAAAYEGLSEVYYYTNRPVLNFYSVLRNLNLAELAGASSQLARSYAVAGLISVYVPLHRAADAYCSRALRTAREIGDLPTLQHVSVVTGIFYMVTGRWPLSRELFQDAMDLARRVGNERRGWDAAGNLALISYFQGDFTEAARWAHEARMAATRRRDLRYMVLQLRVEIYALIALGRLEEASRGLQETRELAAQGLAAERDLTELDISAFTALLSLRRGDAASALTAAEQAAEVLARLSTNTLWWGSLIAVSAVAEVFLTLWEAAQRSPERGATVLDPAHLRRRAASACRSLRAVARLYPIARPAAGLYQGRYEHLSGRPQRALRAWQRSRLEASRFGMPWVEAQAEHELGCHGRKG